MGSSLRSPVLKVSVIRYEQANEIKAKTMTNAATGVHASRRGNERGADQRRHAAEDRGELEGQRAAAVAHSGGELLGEVGRLRPVHRAETGLDDEAAERNSQMLEVDTRTAFRA